MSQVYLYVYILIKHEEWFGRAERDSWSQEQNARISSVMYYLNCENHLRDTIIRNYEDRVLWEGRRRI